MFLAGGRTTQGVALSFRAAAPEKEHCGMQGGESQRTERRRHDVVSERQLDVTGVDDVAAADPTAEVLT